MAEAAQAAPAAAPAPKGPQTLGGNSAAPAQSLSDAYSQLGEIADGDGGGDPTPAPAQKTPPAQQNQPPRDDKGQQQQQPPVKAATLRENYDKLKTDFAAREKELTELKAERVKWQSGGDEAKKLSETLAEREKSLETHTKRLKELEEELRYSAFEKSQDYQRDYWEPFQKAWGSAREEMQNFDVILPDGNTRPAAAEDFDKIAYADYRTAKQQAQAMFGDDWQTVMGLRKQVVDLNNKRAEAVERYRKEGGEREKAKMEAQAAQNRKLAEQWQSENKAGVEKYPEFFKEKDGDPKRNELLNAGMQRADMAFSPPATMPAEERIRLHSAIRNMAGGFPALAYMYRQEQAARKAAEAKLKEYEDSDPNAAGGSRQRRASGEGGAAGSQLDNAVSELDKLMGT